MKNMVKAIPDGYTSITPYLIVDGAARAIDFYKQAFGATELMRMPGPDGRIGHAELRIGNAVVMLADQHPEIGAHGPHKYGGSPTSLMLYTEDVDAVYNKAIGLGAKVERPLADQFYGDRTGGIIDPFGHRWYIATHKEDLTHEELEKRAAVATKG